MPIFNLLQEANATVTLCHSHTKNLADVVGMADILVVAVGIPEVIRGEWLKQGVVVVDVGTNAVPGFRASPLLMRREWNVASSLGG